jgi:hypothetical protein
MFSFALKVFLVASMSSGFVVAQGSTGRRSGDFNYVVTRTVSEAIISINLKDNALILKDFDGKLHTVRVNKETKFPTGAPAITLRDLHEGQRIRVTYRAADSIALEILPFPIPKPK